MQHSSFSILITTKNRKKDLIFTLNKIQYLLDREDVICIVCDDGSTDETYELIHDNFPKIQLIRNSRSKGLIYSRNRMMSLVNTEFAISIDDDLHFITQNPLEIIQKAFNENPKIGIFSFRIFWNLEEPETIKSDEVSHQMKSFAGGANVWRMTAWRDVPEYPAWFVFYGEEDFASYQLFKKKWDIFYLPEILVNHRVNLNERKKDSDYSLRLKRSLRSAWYLYFLFYPIRVIPKKLMYSIWMQIKLKVFKGDLKALKAIILAIFDLIFSIPKIIKNANRLSLKEYQAYQKLEETKLYWQPENKKYYSGK
ncbi:glycosyltransferase family 2 protein [Flavobacterium sp. JLP]|uniref:glycosyltransferase family 2 protein n=1 Tax=unclassified Flavobacterium TaxID=196869 RepID=UPI000493A29B|nr:MULTISPECIES: glycosyltransferase family 2 protein [unclassified Flavobacterium]MBF4507133.1 glycosyltransferase family 2 protein [Flavobacterium sp. JLP]